MADLEMFAEAMAIEEITVGGPEDIFERVLHVRVTGDSIFRICFRARTCEALFIAGSDKEVERLQTIIRDAQSNLSRMGYP